MSYNVGTAGANLGLDPVEIAKLGLFSVILKMFCVPSRRLLQFHKVVRCPR